MSETFFQGNNREIQGKKENLRIAKKSGLFKPLFFSTSEKSIKVRGEASYLKHQTPIGGAAKPTFSPASGGAPAGRGRPQTRGGVFFNWGRSPRERVGGWWGLEAISEARPQGLAEPPEARAKGEENHEVQKYKPERRGESRKHKTFMGQLADPITTCFMLKACAGSESRGGTGTPTNSGADQECEKLQSPTETEDDRNGRTPGDKGHERR